MKTCVKCGIDFGGRRCRECLRRYLRQYRADRVLTMRGRDRAYYAANKDRLRERRAAWRASDAGRAYKVSYRPKQADIQGRRRAIERGVVVEDVDRAAIIARDNSVCHICRKKCRARDIHLDHLVPLSHGGAHTPENLAVSHAACNMKRGAGRLPAQLRLAA